MEASCGICFCPFTGNSMETSCCGQSLCLECFESISQRCHRCPYCRTEDENFRRTACSPDDVINGEWKVSMREKSPLGSCHHEADLVIKKDAGSCTSRVEHLDGVFWEEVNVQKTDCGKTFTAKQKTKSAPGWAGESARVLGSSIVNGSWTSKYTATFTTQITLMNGKGETLVIVQEGRMTRKNMVSL